MFTYARGPLRWYLRATGFQGITMPWRRVYLLEECFLDCRLRAHEEAHLRQIDRLGPWRFTWQYLTGLMRYGYWNHPMEIEAREAEYEALFNSR